MTVYDLWLATTNDIYLRRFGRPPLKLPSGGRLQLEHLPLAQAVVQLLAAIRTFEDKHGADALLHIAADGRVDPGEEARYKETVRDLHGIVQAALQIDYAEKGGSA